MSVLLPFIATAALLSASGPTPGSAFAPAALLLRAGTEVPMKTLRTLTSLEARQGERFDLEVTQDVLAGGALAIPKGARGIGEVRRVVPKGIMGKSGKLEVQLLFVELGGTRIRLGGIAADRGKAGTLGLVGGVILAGVFGSLVTGTSAVIPAGTQMSGYVFKDVAVKPAPSN